MRSPILVALASLCTSAVLGAAIGSCSSGGAGGTSGTGATSGTGGAGSTECASVIATLCEKGHSCSGDSTAQFVTPPDTDSGGGGGYFSDTSNDNCDVFQGGCHLVDLATCQSALAAAQCAPYPDDSGTQGLAVPAACACFIYCP